MNSSLKSASRYALGLILTVFGAIALSVLANVANASPSAPRAIDCKKEPLACAIYFEARGESPKGQLAVAYVVHNRLKDERFPKTARGVVFQKNQFSWANKRVAVKDRKAFEKAREIAAHVNQLAKNDVLYEFSDPTNGAVYFNAKKQRPAHFKKNKHNVVNIGNHVFFG